VARLPAESDGNCCLRSACPCHQAQCWRIHQIVDDIDGERERERGEREKNKKRGRVETAHIDLSVLSYRFTDERLLLRNMQKK